MLQKLLNRFLHLEIPTMCVFNGAALAGGLMFGLVHDFRMMKEEKVYVSLAELNYGVTIPPAYAALVKY